MKKLYWLLGIIMLLLVIFAIQTSYSKYVSQAQGTIEKEAGAWLIKLNNQNIATNSIQNTFTINNLNYVSNQYVIANKMAPTSVGYFDISIDPTGASTAVKYEVTINNQAFQINNAINLDHVSKIVNSQESIQGIIRTGAYTFSGIIDLNSVKNEEITTIRCYVIWENIIDGSNDQNDSNSGLIRNNSFNIPVTVTVSQYLGEQLIQYSNNITNTNS